MLACKEKISKLGHEHSNLINGLIPSWMHNMIALLGSVKDGKWSQVGGSTSLGACPGHFLYPPLCFLSAIK